MAQKKVNKTMVAALTFVFLGLVIVVSMFVIAGVKQRDPQQFVDRAVQFAANKDWKTAARFYLLAWSKSGQREPKYLVDLGDMRLADGDINQALVAWRNALVADPTLVIAHRRQLALILELAELYGSAESWRRVSEAAQAMLAMDSSLLTDDDRAFANHGEGQAIVHVVQTAVEQTDTVAQSIDSLRLAVKLAPNQVEYVIDLGKRLIESGAKAEGEKIFNDLLARYDQPGDDAAFVNSQIGQYFARLVDADEDEPVFKVRIARAGELLKRAVSFAPPKSEVSYDANIAWATYLGQQWLIARMNGDDPEALKKLFEQAQGILIECTKTTPERFEAFHQLAQLYKASGRHEDVVNICDERLSKDIVRKGVFASRNKLFAFRLMLIASESCVSLAVGTFGDDTNSKETDSQAPSPQVSASSRKARDKWLAKAQAYVDSAEGEFPDHPRSAHQAGRIQLASGHDRTALNLFRKAEQAYVTRGVVDWDNKIILARLHLRLGEPGATKDVLESALSRATGGRAVVVWLLYAEALFRNNELNSPRLDQLLADVALRDPENTTLRRLRAAILAQRGDLAGARSLVDSPTAKLLMSARELAGAGDVDGALRVLKGGLAQHPADQQLVGTVVQELLRLDNIDEAKQIVDRAKSLEPDNVFFNRLAVLTQPGLADEDRERELLQLIEQTADPLQRDWELAEFYLRKGEPDRSIQYLNEVETHLIAHDTPMAQNASGTLHRSLLLTKLRMAAQAGDDQAMDEARASAIKYDVDGAKGQYVTGLYHLYRDELERASLAFRDVVDQQPTNAKALAYMGQCLHRLGESDNAQDFYDRAIRINPNEAIAQKGLAVLARQRGDQAAFAVHFKQCKRLSPNDPWVQSELINEQERLDPAAAIVRREALFEKDPGQTENLQRLASLCEQVEDLDKAADYYKLLLKADPQNRAIVLQVSQFFRRIGRNNDAVATLKQYVDGQPSDAKRADAHIILAAYYMQRQDLDAAEQTLLDAADLSETFEVCFSIGEFYMRSRQRGDTALLWFDKAAKLARSQQLPKLRQVLSARIAAMLHRSTGDVEAAREAVKQFRQAYPSDSQGLLWDAEVQARSGNLAAAIDLLTRFLEKQPDHPAALLQRALHYTAMGRMPQAVADLEAIKQRDPLALKLEPRFLLANLYRRADRTDDWLRELESIVQDAPGSAMAIDQLVRAYVAAKRFGEADQIVTSQINRSGQNVDPRWLFLRGRVLLEVGDSDRALSDFRRGDALAGHSTDSIAGVLEVYIRLKRWSDGLDYYEQFATQGELSARLLSRHARLLAGDGQMSAAVSSFRSAMKLAMVAGRSGVTAVMSDVHAAFTDPVQALKHFELSDGDSTRANDRILVRLYRLADQPTDARTVLDRLQRGAVSDQERADLKMELGELFQAQDDAQGARIAYEEALRYNDQNWVALNNLAYLLSDKLGLHSEALAYAKAATKLADTADTLDTLGWIYVQLKQYKQAIAELARSTRLNPNAALTYYHLGEAYRRNGQFIEAKDVFERGLVLETSTTETALAKKFKEALTKTEKREQSPS